MLRLRGQCSFIVDPFIPPGHPKYSSIGTNYPRIAVSIGSQIALKFVWRWIKFTQLWWCRFFDSEGQGHNPIDFLNTLPLTGSADFILVVGSAKFDI
jgi:hypothetical protein